MTYPDASIQKLCNCWWEEQAEKNPVRGSLVFAFTPHVDQVPYTLHPAGREDATCHDKAIINVEPLRIKERRARADLPVAAMTINSKEVWTAYKAKKRPCLALSDIPPLVQKQLTRNLPKKNFAPAIKVAPYYGVDQSSSRAGYPAEFVERVRHAEYRNFFWDMLPVSSGTKESLLRLDHIQPVGFHYNSYELAGWKLTEEALEVVDDWFLWSLYGKIRGDSPLLEYQDLIKEMFQLS